MRNQSGWRGAGARAPSWSFTNKHTSFPSVWKKGCGRGLRNRKTGEQRNQVLDEWRNIRHPGDSGRLHSLGARRAALGVQPRRGQRGL